LPYNRYGKRQWLSLYKYLELYPDDDIFHAMPDYRTEPYTCKWCGGKLKNKRQQSFCCKECSQRFNNHTVWGRKTAPLPYRILCRDNFTCSECGEFKALKNEYGIYIPVDVGLEVHHIIHVSNGGEDHQSNLKTLCEDCHKAAHGSK